MLSDEVAVWQSPAACSCTESLEISEGAMPDRVKTEVPSSRAKDVEFGDA